MRLRDWIKGRVLKVASDLGVGEVTVGDRKRKQIEKAILKKSGSQTPRVELEEIGPSVDFKLRRTKLASEDLYKLACKRPKSLKVKKVKNIAKDVFGTKLGRIHMTPQNIGKLQTRKMKGLRKPYSERANRKQPISKQKKL